MGGDPFGMLLRQRIVFLGGEVRTSLGFKRVRMAKFWEFS